MNACENAPSANKRRNKFGIRNATKNACVVAPAPKIEATSISRTKPVMRDNKVKPLTEAKTRKKFMLLDKRND